MIISELGRAPVSSAKPAGDDIRYEPLFDTLQGEIDAKPSGGSGGTNWKTVVATAATILETRSKDLLVGSYLAVALLHTEGVPQGLRSGIVLLKDLLERFWEDMYPPLKRMRGRTQALNWWVERTEIILGAVTDLPPLQADTLEELVSAVETLSDLISDKCPDSSSLRRILEFIRSLPAETSEPVVVAEKASPPSPPVAAVAVPVATVKSAPPAPRSEPFASTTVLATQDDAARLLAAVMKNNELLLDFMFVEPTPVPSWYHLNLLSAWFEIRKLPVATDNKTLIPPPERQIMTSLLLMKGAANWAGVIKSACYTVRRYPFWLDMNRMAAEALGMLGETYREGKEAVAADSAQFVRRFAGIENYTFSDGAPFADEQTQVWLRSASGVAAGGDRPLSTCGDDVGSKVAGELVRCRELFNSGKQGEGLSIMQLHLQASGSGRERYLWRLSLVQLLAFSGNVNLALPHISELMKDYDTYRLEEWDPGMALDTLRTVWTVLRGQNDPESKRKSTEALSRISLLSPTEAFDLLK
jgi:type VI secretion system protein VasJ